MSSSLLEEEERMSDSTTGNEGEVAACRDLYHEELSSWDSKGLLCIVSAADYLGFVPVHLN